MIYRGLSDLSTTFEDFLKTITSMYHSSFSTPLVFMLHVLVHLVADQISEPKLPSSLLFFVEMHSTETLLALFASCARVLKVLFPDRMDWTASPILNFFFNKRNLSSACVHSFFLDVLDHGSGLLLTIAGGRKF